MTKAEYIRACDSNAAAGTWPEDWHELLKSLAYDRAGDWDSAHGIAQDVPNAPGSAVHAYLHRKEGVQWNAEYWYRRAGRPPFTGSLEEEWLALADELLN
jgi:hypothetical protein